MEQPNWKATTAEYNGGAAYYEEDAIGQTSDKEAGRPTAEDLPMTERLANKTTKDLPMAERLASPTTEKHKRQAAANKWRRTIQGQRHKRDDGGSGNPANGEEASQQWIAAKQAAPATAPRGRTREADKNRTYGTDI